MAWATISRGIIKMTLSWPIEVRKPASTILFMPSRIVAKNKKRYLKPNKKLSHPGKSAIATSIVSSLHALPPRTVRLPSEQSHSRVLAAIRTRYLPSTIFQNQNGAGSYLDDTVLAAKPSVLGRECGQLTLN